MRDVLQVGQLCWRSSHDLHSSQDIQVRSEMQGDVGDARPAGPQLLRMTNIHQVGQLCWRCSHDLCRHLPNHNVS